MSTGALKRLTREYALVSRKFCIEQHGASIFEWVCTIPGPEHSPYHGFNFDVKVNFPSNYPFRPPVLRFLNKMFHPNISKEGIVCLGMITEEWLPTNTILGVFEEVDKLLKEPNLNNPLHPESAVLYRQNKEEYEQRVLEVLKRG